MDTLIMIWLRGQLARTPQRFTSRKDLNDWMKKFEWFSWYFCLIHNLVPVQSRGMATHTHTAKHPHVGGCRHTDSTPTVSTSFNQVRMLPWEPNSEPPFLSLSFLSLCLLIHLCLLSLALPPQLSKQEPGHLPSCLLPIQMWCFGRSTDSERKSDPNRSVLLWHNYLLTPTSIPPSFPLSVLYLSVSSPSLPHSFCGRT